MVSSDLQSIILRILIAHLAEREEKALEIGYISQGLLRAGVAPNEEACKSAVHHLLATSILKNGQGSKVSLTGTGLVLGMGVALPESVELALQNSFTSEA